MVIPEMSTPATDNPRMNAALEYLDMGMSVIPVKRSDKRPYIEWSEFQKRLPTPDEVETWWEKWPEANVAIVTGAISNLYIIDADGDAGIEYMSRHFLKTSLYSKTGNGVHALYRPPENSAIRNSVRVFPGIDIRGEGGYFVAPPSIHQSGHEYKWIPVEGMNDWDDIPVYQPPGISPPAKGNINLDLSGVKSSPINQPVAKGQRNQTLASLVGKWIAADLDMAEIEILARAWNKNNIPPLGEKELLRTIESIHKTDLKNHPDAVLEIPTKPHTDKVPFPEHLLHPGGLMEALMDCIHQSSAVSVPVFNLAGAIAAVGTLAGHRFQTETRLKTNFYVMAIGHAGAGKDAPQDVIPALFKAANASNLIGPTTLASEPALIKHIANQDKARTLLFMDEIGLMLKSLRRPNSAGYEIPATLMKLFSSVNRGMVKTLASGEIVIHWHHVSLYGASTPNHFWQSFTRSDSTDGFLPRILVFESHQNRRLAKRDTIIDVPDEVLDIINAFESIKPPPDKENNLIRCTIPVTVPKSAEADRHFLKWEQSIIDRQNEIQKRDEGIAAIYGRAAEHAHKLALIHALSAYGPAVRTVEMDSIMWAIDMMEFQVGRMIEMIRDNISENEWHANQQKILKAIKKHATPERPGATIREISRGGVRVPEKLMKELLGSLLASGEIVKIKHKPARGFSVDLYGIGKDAEESEDTENNKVVNDDLTTF